MSGTSFTRGRARRSLNAVPTAQRSIRFEGFSVTNGPDLYVYLSGHPRPTNAAELHQNDSNLGRLKAPQGAFSYQVDPSVDLRKIKSVVIHCRAFSVIFSSAELQ